MEENKIYNEDFLTLVKRLPDNSVDCCITDSPYMCTSIGSSGTMSGYWTDELSKKGKLFENNSCPVEKWMPEVYRVLKDGAHFYSMINNVNLQEHLNCLQSCGFNFIRILVWDKMSPICGTAYMSRTEFITFSYKGSFKPVRDCGVSDILSIRNVKSKDKNGKVLHPSAKPIELMQVLIRQSTQKNDLVLDPFGGVMSTAIACIRTKRKYLSCEIAPHYYNIGMKRIKQEESYRQGELFG